MRTIEVNRKQLDPKAYKKRTAIEADATELIKGDCLVTENGQPIILYKKLEGIDTRQLRQAVKDIKYLTNTRTNGLKTTSAIFGYRPRIVLRNDYCTATAMASEDVKNHEIIAGFAKTLTDFYKEYFPDIFQKHVDIVGAKVKPEWVIGDSPFTSGIVNKNNPLKYHHDSGNFKGVLSNMVVFKKDVKGGHLVCPEYGIKFACEDDTVVIFDGQSILHGVSPIQRLTSKAYRYTTVYYSLEQMWKCESVDEELLRIRGKKLERELRRLK